MLQITVFGLGKIGLPLAVQYASKGHKVFGIDVNEKLITDLESGICPISGEEELAIKLKTVLENKNLQVTLDSSTAVSLSDAIVVVVPLYVSSSGEPQFDALDNVTDIISKSLKKDTVICYETTVPVGTTKNRFLKIIESNQM
jgi:UDP-N-acetyl-D-mannosaminuronate dehydrogenase